MTSDKKQKTKKASMSRSNLRTNKLVIETLRCIQFYAWLTPYQIAKLVLPLENINPVHQIKRILKRLVLDEYLDEYVLDAAGSKNIKAYKIRRRGVFLLKKHHPVFYISRSGMNAKSRQYHRFIANEILIEFTTFTGYFSWFITSELDNFSSDCVFTELQLAVSKNKVSYEIGNLPDCAIKDNDENHLILIEVENSVRNIKNKNSKLRAWLDPFIAVTMNGGNKTVWPDKPDSNNDWSSFSCSTQLFVCSTDEIFRAIYRHVFRLVYENIKNDHELYVSYSELSPEQLTTDMIKDARSRLKSVKNKVENIIGKIFFVVLDGKKRWVDPFQDSTLCRIDEVEDYNQAFQRKSILPTPDYIFDYPYKNLGELGKQPSLMGRLFGS
jgi:hypothetical protein